MENVSVHPPSEEDGRSDVRPVAVKKNRLEYLDGLRGVAALMVVTHHGMLAFDFAIYSGAPADSHFPWDIRLSGLPFFLPNCGNFAVCIFFVLSGFVLSRSFSRTDLTPIASAVKRYVRLLVPITAANLLSLLVGILAVLIPSMAAFIPPLAGAHGDGRAISDILPATGFCLVEAFWRSTVTGLGPTTFNGVLWSMPIEFQGSLILILIQSVSRLASGTKRGRETWAAVLALIFFILTWNSYLGLFGAGALLYSAVNSGMIRAMRRYAPLVYGLLIVALFFGTMPYSAARGLYYNAFIFVAGTTFESLAAKSIYHPIVSMLGGKNVWVPYPTDPVALWHSFGAMMLLGCLCLSERLQHLLSTAPCRFLGKISFPLYLVHASVLALVAHSTMQWAMKHHFSYGQGMALAIGAFVPASIVVAYLFGLLFEGRSIRWSHQAGCWIDRWLPAWPVLTLGLHRPRETAL